MTSCGKCSAELVDGAAYCHVCGEPVGNPVTAEDDSTPGLTALEQEWATLADFSNRISNEAEMARDRLEVLERRSASSEAPGRGTSAIGCTEPSEGVPVRPSGATKSGRGGAWMAAGILLIILAFAVALVIESRSGAVGAGVFVRVLLNPIAWAGFLMFAWGLVTS
jgi:hypothetical protein